MSRNFISRNFISQCRAFRRNFLRLAILVAVAGGTHPLSAQMLEIPGGKWWKRPRVVEMLQLTSDQQERMEEIFSKNRRAFIDLKADVERRQLDVEELITKKDSDPKKVSAAIDSLDQSRLRLGKARTMTIIEMKGILSNDQWQLVLDRSDEWRREREEGMRGREEGMRESDEGKRGRFRGMPGGGRRRGRM
ncbi:MAG: periplasmic heavy metal sensor [Thermoanaerobaculia bacterium]